MSQHEAAVPLPRQRLSVRALLRRGDQVLLARIAPAGFGTAGVWTLPGGGVDHGEHPEDSLRREVAEETGLGIDVGPVLGIFSQHFVGRSPTGRLEDFHGIHLVYAANATTQDQPRVVEVDGTTDQVAWVRTADAANGVIEVAGVVHYALTELECRSP